MWPSFRDLLEVCADIGWSLMHIGRKVSFLARYASLDPNDFDRHVFSQRTRILLRVGDRFVCWQQHEFDGDRITLYAAEESLTWCWGWKQEDVDALVVAYALK